MAAASLCIVVKRNSANSKAHPKYALLAIKGVFWKLSALIYKADRIGYLQLAKLRKRPILGGIGDRVMAEGIEEAENGVERDKYAAEPKNTGQYTVIER